MLFSLKMTSKTDNSDKGMETYTIDYRIYTVNYRIQITNIHYRLQTIYQELQTEDWILKIKDSRLIETIEIDENDRQQQQQYYQD